jgi:hypothetical protein
VFTDRRLRLGYRSSGHGSASERVVARTLLSFGANVEVMSPPEVRAELAAVALEIVDLYSNVRLG